MEEEQSEKEKEVKPELPLPLVNRSGFPIDPETWNGMWNYVRRNYNGDEPDLENRIRSNDNLTGKPIIPQPSLTDTMKVKEKIDAIQAFIEQLEYNHTGLQFFEIRKRRPLSRLMETAREMIRQSLPIKCLEAVILGLYLTTGISGLDRFVISFKSKFGTNTHRHVVLGIHFGAMYGAIGLSRRTELMYKPLTFKNLTDLIMDYDAAYTSCFHKLKKVELSFPVPHDCHSRYKIIWDYVTIPVSKLNREEIENLVGKFSKDIRATRTKGPN